MSVSEIDISTFRQKQNLLEGTRWLFVIKSQNQIERRKRLLSSRKSNKFGRIEKRPIGDGMLVEAVLSNGSLIVNKHKNFPECRHVKALRSGEYLLSTIESVVKLNKNFKIVQEYRNPLFAFLHTIDTNTAEARCLVASSGYDSIFELDDKGKIINHWLAWENGFNPDEDGYWLSLTFKQFKKYQSEGKKAKLINPHEYGKEGLITSQRSAHPNLAVYDIYDSESSVIISIGHDGDLYRVSFDTGEAVLIQNELAQMPHGLFQFDNGWCITNTTKGEFWILDQQFKVNRVYSFRQLRHKVPGTENIEWIQQAIPVNDRYLLALDSNRGIITLDLFEREYSIYLPNPNWCFQDAIKVDAN